MSGIESDVANEAIGSIVLTVVFFLTGSLSRIFVTKIKKALGVSAGIGTMITVFVMILDSRSDTLRNILDYLTILVYSSILSQIGNIVTGWTIRFLNFIKNEVL